MRICLTLFALVGSLLLTERATAQQPSLYTQGELGRFQVQSSAAGFSTDRLRASVVNSSIPQFSYSTVNRGLLKSAIGGRSPQKPFASINRGPSVTPYLGLVSDTPFSSTATNYYSLVRPQLEQQKMNEKLQQQNIALQRQLNSVAAQSPYGLTGSEDRAPTGHAAVFMNYGGYYPVTAGPSGRR